MATIKKKAANKAKAKPRGTAAKKASSKKPAETLLSLRRELADALEQQAATGDILRMIARSSGDLQSVMDAIAEKAARLCDADDALVRAVGRRPLLLRFALRLDTDRDCHWRKYSARSQHARGPGRD